MHNRLFALLLGALAALFLGGCPAGEQGAASPGAAGPIFVSAASAEGDGSAEHPYPTIQEAVDAAAPGGEIVVGPGAYAPFWVDRALSGSPGCPTVIRAEEGAVICTPGRGDEAIGIGLENVSYLTLSGFTVTGGSYGIYVECNAAAPAESFPGLTIRDCTVQDIDGVHGIGIYGAHPAAAITDLVVERCAISHCRCGDSEALALNGNIDGFVLRGNTVHDIDNIAIAMIGFEGTPPDRATDFVRSGLCGDNTVWNISTAGNQAYRDGRGYDLCAGGIYVDGGSDIDISGNAVTNCDIGIEVATEHAPPCRVTGVEVHHNTVSGCTGFAGLSIGGYDGQRGFTQNCRFYENTLTDNTVHIAIQRSRDNDIFRNTLSGGGLAFLYSDDLPAEEMDNRVYDNQER